MSIATPALTNFTGGEMRYLLDGRVDLSKYYNGCEVLENFVSFPHGGAHRRSGFRMIAEVKDSSRITVLIPFEFSVNQTYMIEAGHNYFRFYYARGQVLLEGEVYEVANEYAEGELMGIRFAQSADTLLLCHPNHPPRQLVRNDHNDWTLSSIAFTAQPDAWDDSNYPSVIGFYQQRLVIGGIPDAPGSIWFSQSAGDFFNLTTGTNDDQAMKYTLDSEHMDVINGLVSGKRLRLMTEGAEWTINAGSYDSEVLTPTNVKADSWTTIGSNGTRPIKTKNAALFIDNYGQSLHEMAYTFESDAFEAPDLTLLARHIGRDEANGAVFNLSRMAFATKPEPIVYVVRNDGTLCSMTYARDHEVIAWHRQTTRGKFEDVATIHGPDRTEVWCIVNRTINGETKRFVELLEKDFSGDISDAFFVDCGISYSEETATKDFNGADHLAGETVAVLADGAVHSDVTIAEDGTFSLSRAASKVHIGLPYTSKLQPLRLEGGSQRGTSQTKQKRITKVAVRFHNTLGGKVGPDEDHLEPVYFRKASTPMGQSAGAWSGDKVVNFPKGWNRDGVLTIVQDQPLPMTVLMVVPELVINE